MSKRESDRSEIDVGPFLNRILVWARSWQVGTVLAVIALIFVVVSWRSVDFQDLLHLPATAVVGAAVAYAAALGVLALAVWRPRSGQSARLVGSGLATQVLKYVPGTVWQGQRILRVAGLRPLAQFTGVVFVAAGIGLTVAGGLASTIAGLVVTGAALVMCLRFLRLAHTIRVGVLAIGLSLAIWLCGVVLGWGLDLDPWDSGRTVVGAWGFGVLAVPVPAGVGIREFYFSIINEASSAARLALSFRALTLGVDVVVGSIGMWMTWGTKTPGADDV